MYEIIKRNNRDVNLITVGLVWRYLTNMKKVLFFLLTIVCVIALATGIQWYLGKNKEEIPISASSAEDISEGKSIQSRKISGALSSLNITSNSTEDDVLAVMHMMTHQKIIANDKWGAILMTADNLETVHAILEPSNFSKKKELLNIIIRWKAGDFSSVDHDHNTIWRLQGGTIGKAQGIMTAEEERWFIIHNFGEDAAKDWVDNQ